MNRIKRLEKSMEKLVIQLEETDKKKKKFKMPFRDKSAIKQGNKNPKFITVLYLTQKYDARFKVCRIISGDLVVIDNKAHKLNPEAIWRWGKQRFYIVREIDREPVSNIDYEDVRERGDDTEADVPLIKAVLGAIEKKSPIQNKNVVIFIIAALIIGAVIFTFFGGA